MNFMDKYDGIIKKIELMLDIGEKPSPIKIAKENGLEPRVLGDAFSFITNMTLAEYIRLRRLVKALHYRLTEKASIEETAEAFGYPDASALSRACTNLLGVSPTQVTSEMLASHTALTINELLTKSRDADPPPEPVSSVETVLGIPAEQFESIRKVIELNALYNLSNEELEYLNDLSETCDLPIEKAFEYYEDYLLQCENGTADYRCYPADVFRLTALYNMSVSEAQEFLLEADAAGYPMLSFLPKYFFPLYFSNVYDHYHFSVGEIAEAAEYIEDTGFPEKDIPQIGEYIDLCSGDLIETIDRFDELESMYDEDYDEDKIESYHSIWELDEEEYANGKY